MVHPVERGVELEVPGQVDPRAQVELVRGRVVLLALRGRVRAVSLFDVQHHQRVAGAEAPGIDDAPRAADLHPVAVRIEPVLGGERDRDQPRRGKVDQRRARLETAKVVVVVVVGSDIERDLRQRLDAVSQLESEQVLGVEAAVSVQLQEMGRRRRIGHQQRDVVLGPGRGPNRPGHGGPDAVPLPGREQHARIGQGTRDGCSRCTRSSYRESARAGPRPPRSRPARSRLPAGRCVSRDRRGRRSSCRSRPR